MTEAQKDLAERALWTAVQAALSVVTVASLGVPVAVAPVVAAVLSVVKNWVKARLAAVEAEDGGEA